MWFQERIGSITYLRQQCSRDFFFFTRVFIFLVMCKCSVGILNWVDNYMDKMYSVLLFNSYIIHIPLCACEPWKIAFLIQWCLPNNAQNWPRAMLAYHERTSSSVVCQCPCNLLPLVEKKYMNTHKEVLKWEESKIDHYSLKLKFELMAFL